MQARIIPTPRVKRGRKKRRGGKRGPWGGTRSSHTYLAHGDGAGVHRIDELALDRAESQLRGQEKESRGGSRKRGEGQLQRRRDTKGGRASCTSAVCTLKSRPPTQKGGLAGARDLGAPAHHLAPPGRDTARSQPGGSGVGGPSSPSPSAAAATLSHLLDLGQVQAEHAVRPSQELAATHEVGRVHHPDGSLRGRARERRTREEMRARVWR